jgi:uncharacterized protein YprB with RNaseH-like and TPR domain/predicted nuclease with RNAse H fold
MIRNSFVFLPKFGKKTEAGLWKKNIFTWDELGLSLDGLYKDAKKRELVREYISLAEEALEKKDGNFFARTLPSSEHWRLYRRFRDKTVFLDIETTGLSPYYDTITLIGTHDGESTRIFMKDANLNEISDYLKQFEIIVTFNGKQFDVPFIRKFFPEISIPPVHIDLRFLLKSVGYSGPLKKIERDLGIVRDEEIREVDGRQAVVLWNRFCRGDRDALRDLILYNVTDTVNLKNLMDFCYLKKIGQEILPAIADETICRSLISDEELDSLGTFFSGLSGEVPAHEITISNGTDGLEILLNNKSLLSTRPCPAKKTGTALQQILDRIPAGTAGKKPVSVGIDLTGSEARPSGICTLVGNDAYLDLVHTDSEIIDAVRKAGPDIVAIDASLGLPKGRCCTEDSCECRKFGIMRECERELKRRGINVYPTLIPSMQGLTRRGIHLAKILRDAGFTVIESYPGAAQDILGFPRKRVHLGELATDLMSMGIIPHAAGDPVTHDEIDALTNAVNGFFYLAGLYEKIGNEEEGFLVIPQPVDSTSAELQS